MGKLFIGPKHLLTQVKTDIAAIAKEVITVTPVEYKIIEKIKEVPIDVVRYVDREVQVIKEVPVEVVKEVEVTKFVEVIKEVPVEVEKFIEKYIEVPVEKIKEIEVQLLSVPKWAWIMMGFQSLVILSLLFWK